jgi:uncharacterized SAM-binding protein YcdF (DUF218 family)
MLQSFQFSALAVRYVILFAIGLFAALVLPLMTLSMGHPEASYSMPLEQMNQGIDPTNVAVSPTHQEPNFYQ